MKGINLTKKYNEYATGSTEEYRGSGRDVVRKISSYYFKTFR